MTVIEFWLTVFENKGTVVGVLLVSFLIAFASIRLVTPVFESTAVIRVGSVFTTAGTVAGVEDPSALASRLTEQYALGQLNKSNTHAITALKFNRIPWERSDISLTARGPDPREAQRMLAEIIRNLLKEHGEKFAARKVAFDELKQRVKREIANIDQSVGRAAAELESSLNNNPVAAMAITHDAQRKLEYRSVLQKRLGRLEFLSDKTLIRRSEIIEAPVAPEKPVMPDARLHISIAALFGLTIGILVAFIRGRSGR